MSLEQIRKRIAKKRRFLIERYKVKRIGVFGSCARGQSRKHSDVDIVVEFKTTPDIFEFLNLEQNLGIMLGKKVDLVTKKALKSLIKKRILKETVYL